MNESELIQKAKTDKTAVEELLTKYKSLVLTIARRYFIVGGELDDLMQEGMIGLYKAINNFDENKNASFKTFATLCIKRQIQTAIRKANTNKNKVFCELFDNEQLAILEKPSNRENPEKNIISRENYNHLNQVINQTLSKMEKSVLREYLAGKSYEQIAQILQLQKKSVDNALNRIRQKLSHLLDDITI